MQFSCERCGKRYSTQQELRPGHRYRFRCRACGSEVTLLPSAAPEGRPRGEVKLDDAVVTSQGSTGTATSIPTATATATTGGTPTATATATGARRRKGSGAVVAAVVIPAVLAGAGVAFLVRPGAPAPEAAAPASAPGLLNPVIYVGPVAIEQARPEVLAPQPRRAQAPAPPQAPARSRGSATTPTSTPTATATPTANPTPNPTATAIPNPNPTANPTSTSTATSPPTPTMGATSTSQAPDAVETAGAEEDAPQLGGEGFRRPETETPRCVESSVRLPRELAGRLPSSVTLRFAVGRNGSADRVQVLGEGVDPRLASALQAAVTGCRFRPGADAAGRPIRLWVVMPMRFAQ